MVREDPIGLKGLKIPSSGHMHGVARIDGEGFCRRESSPLVSVIITTYGDSSTLSRAVDSVLGQSYKNIELIVVDDNGDEGDYRLSTEEVMRSYKDVDCISYICHSDNLNGSAARNTGIGHATGTYLTFLDNDDLMLRERIANAVDSLEKTKRDAFFCDVLLMAQGRCAMIQSLDKDELTWKDLLINPGCMGTGSNLFLRRSAVASTGLFDVSFRRNQDIEYMLRLLYRHSSVWCRGIGLVKGESSTNNEQAYETYVQTKHHLDSTFQNLISLLNDGEEKERLIGREKELLSVAVRGRNGKAALLAIERLGELGRPVGRLAKLALLYRCSYGGRGSAVEKSIRLIRHLRIRRLLNAEERALVLKLAKFER